MRRLPLISAFALLGGFSQVAQTIQIREMLVVFYGNEISLGLFLGAWLFWVAVGAVLYRLFRVAARSVAGTAGVPEWVDTASFRELLFALLLAGAVPALLLQLAATCCCRAAFSVPAGEVIPLGQWAAAAWLLAMPVSLVLGAAFPAGISAVDTEGDATGPPPSSGYVAEALGSLAAGALVTALLIGRVAHGDIVTAAAVLMLVQGAVVIGPGHPKRWRRLGARVALAVLALGIAVLTPRRRAIADQLAAMRWQTMHPGLERVHETHTPYQHLGLARRGEQFSLIANGGIAFSLPDEEAAARTAALIMAQDPTPATPPRMLFFGPPLDPLAAALRRYPLASLTVVTADPAAWSELAGHLPDRFTAFRDDPRVTRLQQDGRQFLNRGGADEAATPNAYDIIIVAMGDPATAAVNRYYTAEAFQRARALLAPRGVLTVAVTSASNYLGSEVRSYSGAVYHTLKTAFDHVVAVPGDSHRFFAAAAPDTVTLQPDILRERYLAISLDQRLVPADALPALVPAERVAFLRRELEQAPTAVNTDARPITYYYNMLLWGRFSGSGLVAALGGIRRHAWRLFLLPLVVLTVLRTFYDATRAANQPATWSPNRRFSAAWAVAALGLTAMTTQLILLYTYQNLLGYVYERIAQLNGLAMFGMAAGAWIGHRVEANRSPSTPRAWQLLTALIAVAAAMLGLTVPAVLATLPALPEVGQDLLLSATVVAMAACTGAGFPLAMKVLAGQDRNPGTAAAVYESADHWGGAAGGLLAGAVWIPLLGIHTTRLLAVAVLVSAALLLLAPALAARIRPPDIARSRLFQSLAFPAAATALLGCSVIVWGVTQLHDPAPTEPQRRPVRGETLRPVEELARYTGDATFARQEAPVPHDLGHTAAGIPRSRTVDTRHIAGDINGYGGPIHLLVSLDCAAADAPRILHLQTLHHRETPAYVRALPQWLEALEGRSLRQPLRLGVDVDAMSGATVTSAAAIRILNRTGALAREAWLPHGAAPTTPTIAPRHLDRGLILSAVMLIAFFPVYFSRRRLPRLIYLGASVLILGFCCNVLFTLLDITAIAAGRIPGRQIWFLLTGFVAATSLLWGQVYCGFVCPFGALQELIWELGVAMKWRRYPSARANRALLQLKYPLVAIALCAYWITDRDRWITFNPMQSFFSGGVSSAVLALAIIALGASLSYYRFWCRYFCPAGAILSLCNKVALARRLAPARDFRKCDIGARCEYDLHCIQCNRCILRSRGAPRTRPEPASNR